MTWAGRTANSTPSRTDYEDADTNDELQVNTVPAGWTGSDAAHVVTASEVDLYVNVSGPPGGSANDHCATKAEVEAVRTWDYTENGDVPVIGSATYQTLGDRVALTWTEDADIPSWAQAITEVVIERDTGGGFTEIGTDSYGGSPYIDSGGAVGYDYRIRYRGTRDASLVSSYSGTATAS